jgi:hypothetical protein
MFPQLACWFGQARQSGKFTLRGQGGDPATFPLSPSGLTDPWLLRKKAGAGTKNALVSAATAFVAKERVAEVHPWTTSGA